MAQSPRVPASIPVPSADLINYRFDQSDKRFDDMSNKLDQILMQNANFVTEQQVQKLIDNSLQATNDTLNSWRWYLRALVSATLLALATAIFNLLTRHH
jgi:hypothetical protein